MRAYSSRWRIMDLLYFFPRMFYTHDHISHSHRYFISFLPFIHLQYHGKMLRYSNLRYNYGTFRVFQSEGEVRCKDPGCLVQQPRLDRPERCQREIHGRHVHSTTEGNDVTCTKHVSTSRIF